MPDYTLHKGEPAHIDGAPLPPKLPCVALTLLCVLTALFNNFLKEYTDATIDEQKYMVQLVSARQWSSLMPTCSGALTWQMPFHKRLMPFLACQAEIANRERKILEVDIDDVAAVRPRKARLRRMTLKNRA